jgi:hypothetical protein
MGENICQLHIWQGINNQNIQGIQNTNLSKNQQATEEMDELTEQTILKRMTNKHMKKCWTSLAIKEMKIKTTLRFYLTPVKMVIINNTNNNRCWWGCLVKEHFYNVGGNVN